LEREARKKGGGGRVGENWEKEKELLRLLYMGSLQTKGEGIDRGGYTLQRERPFLSTALTPYKKDGGLSQKHFMTEKLCRAQRKLRG